MKSRRIKKAEFLVKSMGNKMGDIITVPEDRDSQRLYAELSNSGIVRIVEWA